MTQDSSGVPQYPNYGFVSPLIYPAARYFAAIVADVRYLRVFRSFMHAVGFWLVVDGLWRNDFV